MKVLHVVDVLTLGGAQALALRVIEGLQRRGVECELCVLGSEQRTDTGWRLPVRDLRSYTGAGWLVALCGDMQTMPGLGIAPALHNVDIDETGRTVGLF